MTRVVRAVTIVVTVGATSALALGGLLAAPAFAKTCGTLGVGDRAFYTNTDALVAISGRTVFQTKISNVRWRGDELNELVRDPERAAMDQLIARAS